MRRGAPPAASRRGRLIGGLVIVAALALALAPMSPTWIERFFSLGWYAALQPVLTSATSLLPVAVLDVLLVGLVVWLGRRAWRLFKAPRGARPRLFLRSLGRCAVGAAVAYLLFLACWGLNYRRPPITDRLDYSAGRVTPAAVTEATKRAIAELNRLHARAHVELAASPTLDAIRVRLAPAFTASQRALDTGWLAAGGRPKHSLLSPFFRWATVDGMINPLGLEVLLNPDVLPVERPAVLAHEWGHLAGWARESEASFVGWLTCLAGDDAARYSGWLSLYWHLRADVPRDQRPALERALAPGPRRDLAAIAERLRRGQPLVQQVSWDAYDSFLKANRVDEGVRSYGEVVTLVVGSVVDEDGRPVLR